MGLIMKGGIPFGSVASKQSVDGEQNSILVSDGEGWIKNSSLLAFSLPTITNESGFIYFSTEKEKAILRLQADSLSSTRTTCYLQISDSAEVSISANSHTTITGNTSISITDSSLLSMFSDNVTGYNINGYTVTSPNLVFNGSSSVVMQHNGSNCSPIVFISGGHFIDIQQQSYLSNVRRSNTSRLSYSGQRIQPYWPAPWLGSSSGTALPTSTNKGSIIAIHGDAIINLEGTPTFQMQDGSSILTSGNADVVFRGGDFAGGQLSNVKTHFYVEPGSHIKIGPKIQNDNYITPSADVALVIESGQIFLSSDLQRNDTNVSQYLLSSSPDYGFMGYILNKNKICFDNASTLYDYQYRDFGKYRHFFSNNTSAMQSRFEAVYSSILNPTLNIEGRTFLNIGDEGVLSIRLAPKAGGMMLFDITSNVAAKSCVKFGGDSNSNSILQFNPGISAYTHISFAPESSAHVDAVIEPNGILSFGFKPQETFLMNFSGNNTEMLCQWDTCTAILNGKNIFVEVEDYAHSEMWGRSSFIMRSKKIDQQSVDMEFGDLKYTTRGKHSITITTKTDYTNKTIEDLKSNSSDWNNFFTASYEQEYPYVESGTLNSEFAISMPYTTLINNITITTSSRSAGGFYVHSSNLYTTINQVINSTEFKKRLTDLFGDEAYVTINSTTTMTTERYNHTYTYYLQLAIINKAKISINTSTLYQIGDPVSIINETSTSEYDTLISTIRNTGEAYTASSYNIDNATIENSEIRDDITYNTTVSDYTYFNGGHLGLDWRAPVQTIRGNYNDGPTFQMYGLPNFLMANSWTYYKQQINIESNNVYDTFNQKESIRKFIKSEDYNTLISVLPANHSLQKINSISQENTILTISVDLYANGWKPYIDSTENNPVLELIGQSELRLHNGIKIVGDIQYGETTLTITGSDEEEPVTFTLTELKKLKELLNT